jgi:2-iminobutanoate/2-iminopropanoate deaminase
VLPREPQLRVREVLDSAGLGVMELGGTPWFSAAVPVKTVIQPEGYRPTPSAHSPGILVGNTLHLSGSTGGDPESGPLVPGGFEPEMRQVMANMSTVLAAAGMDLSNVVQVTTNLAGMADYARCNEICRENFTV